VIFPKAEARHYSAWTVLLWAGMMLSCQSKQPAPQPQHQPTAVQESWTERAAKISQEELDQLAEYVTRLRQLQAQLRDQCPSQEDSAACQQVLEEAASHLDRFRARAIRAVADPRAYQYRNILLKFLESLPTLSGKFCPFCKAPRTLPMNLHREDCAWRLAEELIDSDEPG
jgi:hypothetical protein